MKILTKECTIYPAKNPESELEMRATK